MFAQLLLALLNTQRLSQINRFIARGVELLAGVQLGGFDRRIRRRQALLGGVAGGGHRPALIDRHLHFHPGGILRFIEHRAVGVVIVEVVGNFRLKGNRRQHLRVGVIQLSLSLAGLGQRR